MNPWQRWFGTPIIKFAIHIVILFGVSLNLVYAFNTWTLRQDVSTELLLVSQLQNQRDQEGIQQDYYQSPEYRETYAKGNLLKKKRGEEVINTSSIENEDGDDAVYIPTEALKPVSNIDKWLEFLFGNS
jgi:hypothetical protein